MSSPTARLRPDAICEPLMHQWHVIGAMIPPAQMATLWVSRFSKLLESFLASPRQHAMAVKNPRFAGGPFCAIDVSRVGEVKALLEQTRRRAAPYEELVAAYHQLDQLLEAEAKGLSLEPYYKKVPEALRGYVELTYNLHHSPNVRFLEGMLYRSRYHLKEGQSVSLQVLADDARPFVLSTPVLEEPDRVQLPIPWSDPALDVLFRMRHRAGAVEEAAEVLRVPQGKLELFRQLFTDAPLPPPSRFEAEGVRVRFYGHATVLVESRRASLLIDPIIGHQTAGRTVPRFSWDDLPPRIDLVLLTHNHADHYSPEALMQLRERVGHFVVPKSTGDGLLDPSMKLMLQQLGIRNVIELEDLEELELDGGRVIGVPFLGEHCDLAIRTKIAHLVQLEGRSLLFATDSNAFEPKLYEFVREEVGAVDVLLISTACEGGPMSYSYQQLYSRQLARDVNESRRESASDSDSAFEIARQLKVRCVENYAMGTEPWIRHVFPIGFAPTSRPMVESAKLIARCKEAGILARMPSGKQELYLPPGDGMPQFVAQPQG